MSFMDEKELRKAQEQLRKKEKETGEKTYIDLPMEAQTQKDEEIQQLKLNVNKLLENRIMDSDYLDGETCYVIFYKKEKRFRRYSDLGKFVTEVGRNFYRGMSPDEIEGFKEVIASNGDLKKESIDWKLVFAQFLRSIY